jgi:hypothetical protein
MKKSKQKSQPKPVMSSAQATEIIRNPKTRFELAPTSAIEAFGDFAYEFIERVFGIDECLITDQSSLWDFPGTKARIRTKVKKLYGVEVPDNGNLVAVLSSIQKTRAN